jgi:alcohol dehydrogenase class IV
MTPATECFAIEMPAAVHVGPGVLSRLPAALGSARRVLLVSGARWLASSTWKQELGALLEGREVGEAACPAGEPTTDSVDAMARTAAGFRPDALVAVGGGSVLDCAKALSALLAHGGPVQRFLEGTPGSVGVPGPCVPWVAVPTTAGTGAEVTKNAVVRVATMGVKRSLRSPHLLASTVLADPRFTLSLPLPVAGTCGLDALVQLVEAYLSRKASPFSRSIALGAFGPMLAALRGIPGAPGDLGLRSSALWGSLASGIALANGGLGAAHGFAAGVGGSYDIAHGLLCAVFMPHVLEANAGVIRPGVAELCRAAGGPAGDPVAWLAAEVRGLLPAYGLPADLRAFSIPRSKIPELAERSLGSSMSGNPRELSAVERQAILSAVL